MAVPQRLGTRNDFCGKSLEKEVVMNMGLPLSNDCGRPLAALEEKRSLAREEIIKGKCPNFLTSGYAHPTYFGIKTTSLFCVKTAGSPDTLQELNTNFILH